MSEMQSEARLPENNPSSGAKLCPRCGCSLPKDAAFCVECGQKLASAPAPVNTPAAPVNTPAASFNPPMAPFNTPSAPAESYVPEEDDTPKGKDAPLKTSSYFLMLLLQALPLVNLIVYIIWACSGRVNENRRNLSRAYLICLLVAIGLAGLLILVLLIVSLSTAAVLGESMFDLEKLNIDLSNLPFLKN